MPNFYKKRSSKLIEASYLIICLGLGHESRYILSNAYRTRILDFVRQETRLLMDPENCDQIL
ncbi:hypothetical protein ACU8KH_01810 [Lachancea thermotolerans]